MIRYSMKRFKNIFLLLQKSSKSAILCQKDMTHLLHRAIICMTIWHTSFPQCIPNTLSFLISTFCNSGPKERDKDREDPQDKVKLRNSINELMMREQILTCQKYCFERDISAGINAFNHRRSQFCFVLTIRNKCVKTVLFHSFGIMYFFRNWFPTLIFWKKKKQTKTEQYVELFLKWFYGFSLFVLSVFELKMEIFPWYIKVIFTSDLKYFRKHFSGQVVSSLHKLKKHTVFHFMLKGIVPQISLNNRWHLLTVTSVELIRDPLRSVISEMWVAFQKYSNGNMSLLSILVFLAWPGCPILTLAKKGDFRFSRVAVHEKTFQLEWKRSPSRLEQLPALVRRRSQRWESVMASIIVAKLKTLTILETTESLDRLMSMRILFCQHARRFKRKGWK